MEVIPAIDLLEGRCVRLYQGDYAQAETFDENPVFSSAAVGRPRRNSAARR